MVYVPEQYVFLTPDEYRLKRLAGEALPNDGNLFLLWIDGDTTTAMWDGVRYELQKGKVYAASQALAIRLLRLNMKTRNIVSANMRIQAACPKHDMAMLYFADDGEQSSLICAECLPEHPVVQAAQLKQLSGERVTNKI